MTESSTFLAAGQRYAPPETPCWRVGPQVTVLHVYQGADGYPRIAYRCPRGRITVILAAEIEEAVQAGLLVPVAVGGEGILN